MSNFTSGTIQLELNDKSIIYFQYLNKQWKQVKNRKERVFETAIQSIIKLTSCNKTENISIDFTQHNILKTYINEIWLTEISSPQISETEHLIDLVIFRNEFKFKEILNRTTSPMKSAEIEKLWLELSNLYDASKTLFSSNYANEQISVDLICKIHSMIGNKLVKTPGSFRTINVSPMRSSVIYIEHELVSSRLDRLIEFTNLQLSQIETYERANREIHLKLKILLAGFFFSEFLLIHPFHDGNGRTARLLLSHIIRNETVVPVSLYLQTTNSKNVVVENRSQYREVLEQRGNGFDPWPVLNYVVDCVLDNTRREKISEIESGFEMKVDQVKSSMILKALPIAIAFVSASFLLFKRKS